MTDAELGSSPMPPSPTVQDETSERSSTLAHVVYEHLAQRIARGDFAPSSKLPSEKELCASFGVSRPIIRKALQQLREEGLIRSRQGSGSFVQAGAARSALNFAPVESLADIQRCFEFRLTLEPQGAYFAALRRNTAALDEIERHLNALANATANGAHSEDVDFNFHHAVAVASNNHYHAAALAALAKQVVTGMRLHGMALLGPREGLAAALSEHQGIFQAIRDGDAESARARMTAHITHSKSRLFGGHLIDLTLTPAQPERE